MSAFYSAAAAADQLPAAELYNATGRGFPDVAAQGTGFVVVSGGKTLPGVAGEREREGEREDGGRRGDAMLRYKLGSEIMCKVRLWRCTTAANMYPVYFTYEPYFPPFYSSNSCSHSPTITIILALLLPLLLPLL